MFVSCWREEISKVISGINNQNSFQNLEVCVVLSLAAVGFVLLEMGGAPLPVQPQPSETSLVKFTSEGRAVSLPQHGCASGSSCGHHSCEPLWSPFSVFLPLLSAFSGGLPLG